MYEIGEFVVNATSGICEIKDIVEMDMMGNKEVKSYLLLVPVGEQTARVFIPVDNADARIRHVITVDRAEEIIKSVPHIDEIIVTNEKEREATYKNAVKSCDPNQLVGIIKCLQHRKKDRFEQGKKCTAIDERYSKTAENNLYSELSFVTGRERSEIEQQILAGIEYRVDLL